MVGGRACSNLFFFSMGRDSSAGYWNPETLLRWWVPELSWGLSFTFWLIFLHVFSKSMSMLLATLVLLLVYTSFFFSLDQTMNFSLLNMMRFDLHEPGGNKECSGSLGEWVPPCKATASGEVITRYLSKKCAREPLNELVMAVLGLRFSVLQTQVDVPFPSFGSHSYLINDITFI